MLRGVSGTFWDGVCVQFALGVLAFVSCQCRVVSSCAEREIERQRCRVQSPDETTRQRDQAECGAGAGGFGCVVVRTWRCRWEGREGEIMISF